MNVLPAESFETRHIPGAVNVPFESEAFEAKASEAVPQKDAAVVTYCTDEDCDLFPQAAKKLEEMGYENVKEFEAGLKGWRRAGFELEGKPKRV